jgi:amino acid transporter
MYELLICFFLSECISNIIVIIFYLWVMIVFYIFILLCLFWLVSMNNWNIFLWFYDTFYIQWFVNWPVFGSAWIWNKLQLQKPKFSLYFHA